MLSTSLRKTQVVESADCREALQPMPVERLGIRK